jgi:hypothetical protein
LRDAEGVGIDDEQIRGSYEDGATVISIGVSMWPYVARCRSTVEVVEFLEL